MGYVFGAADAFDALVYAEHHPKTLAYLQNRIHEMSQNIVNVGKGFIEKAQAAFNHYNGSAAIRFAREVMQVTPGAGVDTNRVMNLWELESIQSASVIMQRWIMANPNLRKLYYKQQCDGYSDTYVDVHPTDIGDRHYDYRMVKNGIMDFEEDGAWVIKQFLDPLVEGDRPLDFLEKVDILRTWSATDLLLALGGGDPTSNSGGSL